MRAARVVKPLVVVALAVASGGCHVLQQETGCYAHVDGPNPTQYAYEPNPDDGTCLLDLCPGDTRYDPQTDDCFTPGLR